MANVFIPKRPQEQPSGSGLGTLMGAVGGIAGTALSGGNPAVGMAASQVGQQLGKGIAPGSPGSAGGGSAGVQVDEQSALSRRKAVMDESPLMQIRESMDALKTLPPEQQAGLADPLVKAHEMARKQGYR